MQTRNLRIRLLPRRKMTKPKVGASWRSMSTLQPAVASPMKMDVG
ncbi:MAG TPA: hypothetical protein VJR92_03565 [Gemmatimonadaceae bacterium]|nr:hypothetical protein [Gemmatimonadaceae bacterium]